MEIRHIKYFIKITESMSFTQAAKDLYIAQPAISQQIAELEEELGVKLFSRAKRQIELTDAGKIFLSKAQRILQDLEKAKDITVRTFKGEIGEISIGFIGPPCVHFLPELIKKFRAKHPNIKVSLYEMLMKDQLEGLKNGSIDVSFGRPFDNDYSPKIQSQLVYQDNFMAVVPDNHPLADKNEISMKDLEHEKLILIDRDHDIKLDKQIMRFFQDSDIYPEIYFRARSPQSVITMVASESGIGILPFAASRLFTNGVKFIPLLPYEINTELYVHWNAEKISAPIDFFMESYNDCFAFTREQ